MKDVKYYAVISNDKLFGVHERKEIVVEYIKRIMKYKPDDTFQLYRGKESKLLGYFPNLYEYYLTPSMNHIYVPMKYYDEHEISCVAMLDKYYGVIDILKKELLDANLMKKELKALEHTILYLTNKIEDLKEDYEDIHIDDLKRMHDMHEQYRYGVDKEDYNG